MLLATMTIVGSGDMPVSLCEYNAGGVLVLALCLTLKALAIPRAVSLNVTTQHAPVPMLAR